MFLDCAFADPKHIVDCGLWFTQQMQIYMSDWIQKCEIDFFYNFFLILHRGTRKTIPFKMVLAGLKSVDEKSQTQTLKSAHHSTARNWRR